MPITVAQDPDTSDWLLTVGDVTTRVPVEQVEEFQHAVKAMQAVPAGPRVGDLWDGGGGLRFVVLNEEPVAIGWLDTGAVSVIRQQWENIAAGCRYLGRAA